MTKAEIITLIHELGRGVVDADTIAVYYEEVINDLGRLEDPPMVNAEHLSLSNGTAVYSFPSRAVSIRHVFFNDRYLHQTGRKHLESYSTNWRTTTGSPIAWTVDDETARKLRFFPTPDFDSGAFIPPFAQPFGEDYPTNIACTIYGDTREYDIPDWLVYVIAFKVLAREFAHPSDHQDLEFAKLCDEVANLFFALIRGYDVA